MHGKQLDDLLEVPIEYKDAFGEHDPEPIFTDDLANIKVEQRFVGAELEAHNDKGEALLFHVKEIADRKITNDANHQLAGQDITFVIKVREVRKPTKEDLVDQPGFTVQ